jgi:hypothetical protein
MGYNMTRPFHELMAVRFSRGLHMKIRDPWQQANAHEFWAFASRIYLEEGLHAFMDYNSGLFCLLVPRRL